MNRTVITKLFTLALMGYAANSERPAKTITNSDRAVVKTATVDGQSYDVV